MRAEAGILKDEEGILNGEWRMPNGRGGFTLIEVMLAIVILGLGLGVLMSAASRAVAVAAKARDYEVARTLIYRLELEEPLQLDELKEDDESGSFGSDYPGIRWEREVVEYGEDTDLLFKVTTRVIWSSTRGENFEQVETLIHQPSAQRVGFVKDSATNDLF